MYRRVALIVFCLSSGPLLAAPPGGHVDKHGDPLPPGAIVRIGTVRFRYRSVLESVAFSPDGKTLAGGGWCDEIQLWDVPRGHVRRVLPGHGEYLNRLAFLPDGRLASVGKDEVLRIRDAGTGKQVHALENRRLLDIRDLRAVMAVSPDGKWVASAANQRNNRKEIGRVVRIWNAETGAVQLTRTDEGDETPIMLAFAADSKMLVLVTDRGGVRRWELPGGRALPPLEILEPLERGRAKDGGGVGCAGAALSPDGQWLAVAYFQELHLWDLTAGKEHCTLKRAGYIRAPRFAPNGTTLAWAEVCNIFAADLPKLAQPRQLGRKGRSLVVSLAFSPDGKVLAAARANSVDLVDAASGKDLTPVDGPISHMQYVGVTTDGKMFVAACENGVIAWDVVRARERFRIRDVGLKYLDYSTFALAPDRTNLVIARRDGIALWDLVTGERRAKPIFSEADCLAVAFSRDGSAFAVAEVNVRSDQFDARRRVRSWDFKSGKEHPAWDQPPARGSVSSLAFGRDERTLILGGRFAEGPAVKILRRGAEPRTLSYHPSRPPHFLAVSSNGRLLATADSCSIWDFAADREFCRLPEKGTVVAFARDGKTLAMGDGQGTVRLWEMATRQERLRLVGHSGMVTALDFAADGRRLASGGSDSTALLWDLGDRARGGPARAVGDKELPQFWNDLADQDAVKAYRALWFLASDPQRSVAFLKPKVRPIPTQVDPAIARLLVQLDDERFAIREDARCQLEELGHAAEPALRRKLTQKLESLELRRRLERLVDQLDTRAPAADGRRTLRAIELLELASDPAANALLKELAGGATESRVTHEARAALERLADTAQRR
jgi:WD40 repeat protein